jgi:hypothetical protein
MCAGKPITLLLLPLACLLSSAVALCDSSRTATLDQRDEVPTVSVARRVAISGDFAGNESDRGGLPVKQLYAGNLDAAVDTSIDPATSDQAFDDYTRWPTDILDWQVAPVDLSFLNAPEKPAGRRGFVRVSNNRLAFEDGTPVRFWGTNLTASALFETARREDVKIQARRLSELGFNLVRLHHHDSDWVNPNIFGDQNSPDTKNLSAAMLERLDWWIKCLKDEGIYIWLDLHVGRQFKLGDEITDFDEIRKGRPTADLRGYNYVNTSIQEAMQRFNEAYVNHVNVFTGMSYRDEPAIAAMMLTNENDVTNHFGNRLLPNQNVPHHSALYMAQAEAFAAKYGLPKETTWRSWEHGPSKLFLNDLEFRFNVEMIQRLRALGVKVPIVTTSTWAEHPLSSLPALTAGDMIDTHSYGSTEELEKNPVYEPNLTHWIAAAQIAGRPLSVTEWNVSPFPVRDRHTIPLYIASSASLQGWHALMQYAYSQHPLTNGGAPSNWAAFNDPGLLATLPAAALLYRRNDVQEARTIYAFAPTHEQLFNRALSPANSVALRTAAERGKLVIALPQTRELPWLDKNPIPMGAKVITDPALNLIDSNAHEAASDSGELRRNWVIGVYTIDTPRTQAAIGWIGGRSVSLTDVDITVTTPNATVAVQSLDEKNISESDTILISLGARSVPKSANELPFYSEPVIGRLTIRASKGLKLYKQRRATKEQQEIAFSYDGRYQINLDRDLGTYWLLLK